MLTAQKWISCLTVATVMSLTAATAVAAGDAPAKTVKAWDLDLGKASDVETLYGRVHAAATDVCRTETERYYRSTRMRAPSGWQRTLRAGCRGLCGSRGRESGARCTAHAGAARSRSGLVLGSALPAFADARPKTRAAEVELPQRHGLDGLRC